MTATKVQSLESTGWKEIQPVAVCGVLLGCFPFSNCFSSEGLPRFKRLSIIFIYHVLVLVATTAASLFLIYENFHKFWGSSNKDPDSVGMAKLRACINLLMVIAGTSTGILNMLVLVLTGKAFDSLFADMHRLGSLQVINIRYGRLLIFFVFVFMIAIAIFHHLAVYDSDDYTSMSIIVDLITHAAIFVPMAIFIVFLLCFIEFFNFYNDQVLDASLQIHGPITENQIKNFQNMYTDRVAVVKRCMRAFCVLIINCIMLSAGCLCLCLYYALVTLAHLPELKAESVLSTAAIFLCHALIMSLGLFLMCTICEEFLSVERKLPAAIATLIDANRNQVSKEVNEMLMLWWQDVVQHPVRLNVRGLFYLDNQLFQAILLTILTYLMVLLQLEIN